MNNTDTESSAETPEAPKTDEQSGEANASAPLRSQHTASFPPILERLGITVALTTYQAGHLILLRADGKAVNTHFRRFPRPMGMAFHDGRLAIGTRFEIVECRDVPAVGGRLEPAGRHDACFLPRRIHVTGDVHIHDLAFAGLSTGAPGKVSERDEVWFVNTAFSCLCTRSNRYNFEPRWRPRFITKLALEDRCHLNGLAVQDGKVRWVTALGETDDAHGWRKNKRDGGVLIDVATNEIITRGLSMPHSPRWYGGRLWILQSGTGGVGTIDLATGRYEELARLPGFTRGLAFRGQYAFVGLSQVRETALFGGIPLVEAMPERNCGVWALDIHTGQTVGFVQFKDAVQEIFAVEVLPCRYPDLINDDADLLAKSYEMP